MTGLFNTKKKYGGLFGTLMDDASDGRGMFSGVYEAAYNPIYTADPTQTIDAARSYSQGVSSGALGVLPGAGLFGAAGYTPSYGENWFFPSGVEKGPSIKDNLDSGNYLDAALQGAGLFGDAAYVAGAASMVPKSQQRGMIRAFHGSPYDFDEFRLDKIGTGEGAQAYGHGLYFAENEGVADAYRKALTSDALKTKTGDVFDSFALEHLNVRNAFRNNGVDLDKTINRAQELLKVARTDELKGMLSRDIGKLNSLKNQGGIAPNPGRMYEVNINADPDKFLDWDKPLSEQPKEQVTALKEGYKKAFGVSDRYLDDNLHPGATLNSGIGPGRMTQQMTENLKGLGIPGIKYLDQGSRGTGQGTRNYVVFDPSTIKILRKYGLFGPAVGAGLFSQTSEDGL